LVTAHHDGKATGYYSFATAAPADGYDLYTVKQGAHFRVTQWVMFMLMHIMPEAGIDLDGKSPRSYLGFHGEGVGVIDESLFTCFGMNDGWWVRPEECQDIAEKLSEHTVACYWGLDMYELVDKLHTLSFVELEFIIEFAGYCESARQLGGFCVF